MEVALFSFVVLDTKTAVNCLSAYLLYVQLAFVLLNIVTHKQDINGKNHYN